MTQIPSSRGTSLFDAPPDPPGRPVPPLPRLAWSEEQVRAVDEVVAWRVDPSGPRVLKLTGPAGAGKTEVMRELRRRLAGTRTRWAATTGKAALRLRSALGVRETSTLHSALYHPPREVDRPDEGRVDLEFDSVRAGDADGALLVCDEASMVGLRLRGDVDRAPYARVLLVGDPFQIPPVLSRAEEEAAGGDDYSVFAGLPGPHLSRVMRAGGAVLRAVTRVREVGAAPTESGEEGGTRYDFFPARSPNDAVLAAVEEYLADREGHAVICWKNESRMLANAVVRHRLGREASHPEAGEPLVVRKNHHRKGLMNGDAVRVVEVGPPGPELADVPTRYFVVADDLAGRTVEVLAVDEYSGQMPYVGLRAWREACSVAGVDEGDVLPLTFGYALTCHAAQGSQYRRVSVAVAGDHRSLHFVKPTRLPDGGTAPFAARWLYTALSRAVVRAGLHFAR